jgi:hypothetical protein
VDETRLFRPQQVARASQLQVLEGNLIPGAQLGVVLQDRQAAVCILVD